MAIVAAPSIPDSEPSEDMVRFGGVKGKDIVSFSIIGFKKSYIIPGMEQTSPLILMDSGLIMIVML